MLTGNAFARWLAAATFLLALLCATTPAHADLATEKAKAHNELAKKLFNLGLFHEAAEEYLKAYQSKPLPAFLFNLAQCHKRMTSPENMRKAIFYYRSFLQNAPETPARRQILEEIVRLERELAVAEKPRPRPLYKKWWFWSLVGVAVVGTTVGTAIALRPEDAKPANVSMGNYPIP